jgi:hypothetical protein
LISLLVISKEENKERRIDSPIEYHYHAAIRLEDETFITAKDLASYLNIDNLNIKTSNKDNNNYWELFAYVMKDGDYSIFPNNIDKRSLIEKTIESCSKETAMKLIPEAIRNGINLSNLSYLNPVFSYSNVIKQYSTITNKFYLDKIRDINLQLINNHSINTILFLSFI